MAPVLLTVVLLASLGCAERALRVPEDGAEQVADQGAAACSAVARCHLLPQYGTEDACTRALSLASVQLHDLATRHVLDNQGCLTRAGDDCAAARRCLNGGVDPGPCLAPRCDGSVLHTCIDGLLIDRRPGEVRFDCASLGLSCVVSPVTAACGRAACPLGNPDESCEGNVIFHCAHGVLAPLRNCGVLACTLRDVGSATCAER